MPERGIFDPNFKNQVIMIKFNGVKKVVERLKCKAENVATYSRKGRRLEEARRANTKSSVAALKCWVRPVMKRRAKQSGQ